MFGVLARPDEAWRPVQERPQVLLDRADRAYAKTRGTTPTAHQDASARRSPSGDCRQKLKIEVSTAPHSTRSGRGASCRCWYAAPIERKLQERRQPTAMPHAHAGACARTPLCTVLAGAHFLALCGAACRPACVTNRHGRRLRARHLVRRASRPQHPSTRSSHRMGVEAAESLKCESSSCPDAARRATDYRKRPPRRRRRPSASRQSW